MSTYYREYHARICKQYMAALMPALAMPVAVVGVICEFIPRDPIWFMRSVIGHIYLTEKGSNKHCSCFYTSVELVRQGGAHQWMALIGQNEGRRGGMNRKTEVALMGLDELHQRVLEIAKAGGKFDRALNEISTKAASYLSLPDACLLSETLEGEKGASISTACHMCRELYLKTIQESRNYCAHLYCANYSPCAKHETVIKECKLYYDARCEERAAMTEAREARIEEIRKLMKSSEQNYMHF